MKPMPKQTACQTLSGRIKVDIIRQGKVIKEGHWIPNLILDAGLDKLAEVAICDLFCVAVKGNDTASSAFFTKECTSNNAANIPAAGSDSTYTFTSTEAIWQSGTRVFTTADVGKLMKLSTGEEAVLTAYTDNHHMDIRGVGLNAIEVQASAKMAWFYGVRSSEWVPAAGYTEPARIATENGRTSNYSETAGENGTEDNEETRTHTRTFIFDAEPENLITGDISCSVTLGGTTITKTAGTSFTANDVGSFIKFTDDDEVFEITSYTSATEVEGYSLSTEDGTAAATHTAIACDLYSYNTYTHIGMSNADAPGVLHDNAAANGTVSGTTLTASGSVFTSKDLGRWIVFPSTGEQVKIIEVTSGTVVELANELTGAYSSVSFDIYENTSLNILVRLIDDTGADETIVAVGENPSYSGQQIKLTYILESKVSPKLISSEVIALIADPGNSMSVDKSGFYITELHSSSIIGSDGQTDLTNTALEPFDPAHCALSTSSSALIEMGSGNVPTRVAGAVAEMTALGYTAGEFSQLYQAVFGSSEGNGATWRTMGIYDNVAELLCFVFRFDANQNKNEGQQLTLRFRKSWNRVLTAPTE